MEIFIRYSIYENLHRCYNKNENLLDILISIKLIVTFEINLKKNDHGHNM